MTLENPGIGAGGVKMGIKLEQYLSVWLSQPSAAKH
jgi:hypothetical protein